MKDIELHIIYVHKKIHFYVHRKEVNQMIATRPEYMRLLSDMREPGKFDIIVIKSLDRLNRSAKNWYLFVEELVSNDKLLYVYMDRDFYKTDDNLMTGIKAILAEQYSRDLSRKINNAHRYRQKNGTTVLLNNNTYGYRKTPDGWL